ncbi:MAG: hypothetical protein U1E07_10235 [Hydrocarboniphaga sp.]|nr:hypothetical protein [Hydrocarboniphaga sp.]MDZ4078771.1 hypothetical protein [Hydrocarboniphaga sp.]
MATDASAAPPGSSEPNRGFHMSNIASRTAKTSGFALAAAAASLFLTAPMAQAESAGSGSAAGHCMGANACKGQGACKTAANACKGQNGCKGQGFTEASEKDCTASGGKFEKPSKK